MTNVRNRWKASGLGRSFYILPQSDQRKLIAVSILLVFMGILDLLGVMAIGLLSALSVTGIQSQPPVGNILYILEIMGIADNSFEFQAIVLCFIAVFLLIGRTLLSIFFTRRILFFLSLRGAKISANLISRLLALPLLKIQERTIQDTLFSVTRGVEWIVLQILATAVVLISDISLLIIMAIGLFIVDPSTALGIILVFGLVAVFLYRLMHVRASYLGLKITELNVISNEKIVEVFSSYRESVVRNRRDYYARDIGKLRHKLADITAEAAFMPYISKYVIETTVIFGAVLIGLTQFILRDAVHAVTTLGIFLAAGTRIAPAVLRIQQGSILIRGAMGSAIPTLELIHALGNTTLNENIDDSVDIIHAGFTPEICISGVGMRYPHSSEAAISGISFNIPSGTSVAIVGPSGAGKTTIVDVLLGVLQPDEGEVLISGISPMKAVAQWPGAISYVPQDIIISSGSIRENVAMGYPISAATDELVYAALQAAQLDQYVSQLPNGIDTQVGERGTKLSGGQRQRLGIARAMFTRPLLLVLDEATSSLDGETEAAVSEAIYSMRGSTTVVLIAHRLSTVRSVDNLIYLSKGKIEAIGSFDSVRQKVSDFDSQAKLMGL